MKEPLPLTLHIFYGHPSRTDKKVFEGIKEGPVEVNDIENKIFGKRPEGFLGLHILLPAVLAETPLNNGSAIQAIFVLSFGVVRHVKFFLKIGTKNTVLPCIIPFPVCIFYI
jgi:hypothetical protein